jgi:CheY-like chemotaxis protein
MGIEPVKVLLVGEGARNSLQLLQWLSHRGCSCQVAQSCRDACNLVSRTQFDLVLSQYQLPDRTAFPLVDGLAGSPATLFFSTRVESGSLWLKMLERGKRCIGAKPAPTRCPCCSWVDSNACRHSRFVSSDRAGCFSDSCGRPHAEPSECVAAAEMSSEVSGPGSRL